MESPTTPTPTPEADRALWTRNMAILDSCQPIFDRNAREAARQTETLGLVEIEPMPALEIGELDGFNLHCTLCDDRWDVSLRSTARHEAVDHTDWHESGASTEATAVIAAQGDEIMAEFDR